ncbi:hypothetical protein [Natronolimnohabitans innermongolicus]|nr:hypothetical protein [Natronolimnohabitans innermongolicus]
MSDEFDNNRRSVLKSMGIVGGAAIATPAVSGSATASDEQVEPQSSVPGVTHVKTFDGDDICYAAAGMCLLIPTPAGSVAAKGCVVGSAGCFAYETLDRLGWSGCEIDLYSVPPFMPQPYVVIPQCIPNPTSFLIDLINEHRPSLPSPFAQEAATEQEDKSDLDENEWIVSQEFADEYEIDTSPETVSVEAIGD